MGRTFRVRKRYKGSESDPQKLVQTEIINLSKALHTNGWSNEAALDIGEFRATGRGVYSSKNIPSDGLIISLPIESMISIVTIENDSQFLELLRQTLGNYHKTISSQSLLSFYLLYLKHFKRKAEYISTIPNSFSVPYFCDEQSKANMIQSVQIKLEKQSQMIDTDYQNLCKCFNRTRCCCCDRFYFDDIIQKTDFERAFFAVNSRSVYFGKEIIQKMRCEYSTGKLLYDDPNLALAPYLDLLNHNHTAKTVIKTKCDGNIFKYEIYSGNSVKKYQQIFINYGALDNVKLIADYGFYLPDNPHDAIEINSNLVKQELEKLPYKLKVFIIKNNLDMNLFITRESGICHQLHSLAFIVGKVYLNNNEFHENHFKRIVYGDANDVIIDFKEKKMFLKNILRKNLHELETSLATFSNRELNESELVYKGFLENRLKWVAEIFYSSGVSIE